jgi:uncharacterized membrane protein YcfT
MLTASTSLWYLYALVVYFILCKLLSRWSLAALVAMTLLSVAINFLPSPWWGMNSVLRNMIYYSLGHGLAALLWMRLNASLFAATPSCWRWRYLLRWRYGF